MPDIHATLEQHFGHKQFRPGQEQVIQTLLAGRSALAIFPTMRSAMRSYQPMNMAGGVEAWCTSNSREQIPAQLAPMIALCAPHAAG